jgi:asparagine synthase (glutamine-hydrolysing)
LEDAGWNLSKIDSILQTYYDSFGQSIEASKLPSKSIFFASWYGKRLLKKILKREVVKTYVDSKHPRWRAMDKLNQQLYVSTHQTILPTLFRNYDRYSMANSVEIRMPFMDHRLVAFAFALPWTSKIRNGFSKSIVRDAVARYIPKEVAYRKTKIGFNSPIVDWMQGPLKSFMLDTISSQSFKECQLIDSRLVENKIRQVISNPKSTLSLGTEAWTLLTPYLWEQAVIKRKNFA